MNDMRLRRGALTLADISASTMANIGPAYSFYFGFGFIALTAGEAAPLTFVLAGVAIALLGNTLAQFSRVLPSAGGFITFVGKTFGPTSALATTLLVILGYVLALSSVLAVSGGYCSAMLTYYLHMNIPWGILMVVFTAGGAALMVRGVTISTKIAAAFFGVEMLVMVVVAIVVIVKTSSHLSGVPFDPGRIPRRLSGLAAAFPLAVYSFLGWENSASLAEETSSPRRNVPRAIAMAIALISVSYVLFAYATVSGFGYNAHSIVAVDIPFIALAHSTFAPLGLLAYLAGLTSTLGVLISAANSQARLLFSAGREGLLPRWVGRVDAARGTPKNAILLFTAVATLIVSGWALAHVVGGHGTMSWLDYFAEASTLGTILVLIVYALANAALPFYFRKHHASEFRAVRHVVFPALGIAAIGVPMYYLLKPGQKQPYDWFPWIALITLILFLGYAIMATRRNPAIGEQIGSLIADE